MGADRILMAEKKATTKKYKYVLDSIIITNKSHFKPKADSHFVSLLTVNKELYKNKKYSRLSRRLLDLEPSSGV